MCQSLSFELEIYAFPRSFCKSISEAFQSRERKDNECLQLWKKETTVCEKDLDTADRIIKNRWGCDKRNLEIGSFVSSLRGLLFKQTLDERKKTKIHQHE